MTKILCTAVILLASCFPAMAQQTSSPQPPSWARLEALPSGVDVHVSAQKKSLNCMFKGATEEALTCVSHDGARTEVFPRAEVKSVKLRHRGRSTLAGAAIGVGVGAAVGAPLGRSGSFVGHGAAAVIIAIPGAIIGAIVGASTDFTHSTIYKAG
jgi:uncharacterized protein YcfJ